MSQESEKKPTGLDAMRDVMKKALKEKTDKGIVTGATMRTARGLETQKRDGTAARRRVDEFMSDFDTLCARHGISSVDLSAFVRSSVNRLV